MIGVLGQVAPRPERFAGERVESQQALSARDGDVTRCHRADLDLLAPMARPADQELAELRRHRDEPNAPTRKRFEAEAIIRHVPGPQHAGVLGMRAKRVDGNHLCA